jgi:hypothetical protein
MRGYRGGLSLSLAVVAAAQLLYNRAGHAQAPPAEGEPEVEAQGTNVAPVPPPASPPAGPYAPPPGYPAAYGRVAPGAGPVVTLRADKPGARLQTQGPLKWQDVCVAPCNVPVNPAGLYRVGGGTIRPSDEFNLPRKSSVLVDAQVGSTVKHWVGIGLIIGGVASAAGGILYYAAANDVANSGTVNTADTSRAVGIVYMVIGAILVAVGIPLSLSSTSVEVH